MRKRSGAGAMRSLEVAHLMKQLYASLEPRIAARFWWGNRGTARCGLISPRMALSRMTEHGASRPFPCAPAKVP
jgi:hypothetical protein